MNLKVLWQIFRNLCALLCLWIHATVSICYAFAEGRHGYAVKDVMEIVEGVAELIYLLDADKTLQFYL